MNYDDFKRRMQRLYIQVDKRFDAHAEDHIKPTISFDDKSYVIDMDFSRKGEEDAEAVALNVIEAIAGMKDSFINQVMTQQNKTRNEAKDIVYRMIEEPESLALQLSLDIWNQDKHGEAKAGGGTYRRWTGDKRPRIAHASRSLRMSQTDGAVFGFSHAGEILEKENTTTVINAEVVDKEGNFLMSLDDLVSQAMKRIENFVAKNQLVPEADSSSL